MSENNGTHTPPGPHPVVVIGRQFGSGGRRIGKIVAELLGLAYYDKELLSEAAQSFGIAKEIFAAHDEKRPSPLSALLQGAYGIADNFHDISVGGQNLYREQSKAIRRICLEGPCVIVGRTADYVMRDHPGLVSVFLHAPLEFRVGRITGRGEAGRAETAREMAQRNDRNRESYYNYYTGRHWGRADNYHLTLDSSTLTDREVAEIIAAYVKAKTGHPGQG